MVRFDEEINQSTFDVLNCHIIFTTGGCYPCVVEWNIPWSTSVQSASQFLDSTLSLFHLHLKMMVDAVSVCQLRMLGPEVMYSHM